MEINIKNMDKVEILRRLYNNSKPQGMGIVPINIENQ
jgi:ASC-1-like (ASCH) protein